ncbi:Serine threonine- kinase haspin, partial [Paramuricea clavata]
NCVSSANDDEARCNVPVKNRDVHNSANKNEDGHTTASEKGDICHTANKEGESCNIDWTAELTEDDMSLKSQISNSSATTSLEVEIKLQKLSSSDIQNVSYKIKSLSWNEDATRHDVCNNVDNCSHENLSENHKVVSHERDAHSVSNRFTCTQIISEEMENAPIECKCKDFDESSQHGKTLPTQNKRKKDPNGYISEINPISKKDRSYNNQLDDCKQEEANPININEEPYKDSTKPVHLANMKTLPKKLAGLCLLDAKVYLNKKEGLTSSSSGAVKNSNISAPQNSLGSVNVNGDAHPETHSGDNLQHLPSSGIHPPKHSGDGLPTLPPRDSHPLTNSPIELPALSSSEVHQSIPSSCVLPQHSSGISGQVGFAEVTPKNFDIHTPLNGQHTGKIKNPNYSSFAEALTPAIIHKCRKKSSSSMDNILVQCEQRTVLKFTDVLSPSVLAKCVKVGEGTFGEVYKTNDGVQDIALKVIPVEGNFTVNNEPQKSFEEMTPEIVISKELSKLGECDDVQNAAHVCSNFIKVKRVMLVQDSYPEKLLQEWDRWRTKHNCENERPDMFESDQYFVVFEFLNGGEDMERFQFNSMDQALSVLQQVALSLSVAEESLLFEHRDLHWGNVLIKKTKCKEIHYKLCGEDIFVKSAGVFVSIIDFTLSRLTKDGTTVYCDLSKDPNIFKGKGDYQFQVYRLMRKANSNDWECHKPYSNVLWMRYLIDKVLNAKKYKKANNSIQRSIRTYLRQVLSYDSALEAVQDGFLGLDVSDEH